MRKDIHVAMVNPRKDLQQKEFSRIYSFSFMDYVKSNPSFSEMTKAWKYLKGGVTNFLNIFECTPLWCMLTSKYLTLLHASLFWFLLKHTLFFVVERMIRIMWSLMLLTLMSPPVPVPILWRRLKLNPKIHTILHALKDLPSHDLNLILLVLLLRKTSLWN